MKRKMLALILAAAMVFSLLPTMSFAADADISGHWAEGTLLKWSDMGWFTGDGAGTYRPQDAITRAEFMALVNRMKGFSGTSGTVDSYSDVSKDKWYYDTVSAALAAGYISGYVDGTIRPENPISRQEAMTIVARLSGGGADGTKFLNAATDGVNVVGWARTYVEACIANGLVAGSGGRINPVSNITRAETVVLLDRIYSDTRTYALSGTYGPESASVNVASAVISGDGVRLQNMKIAGNVEITSEVGEGEVWLTGVDIGGKLVVAGGGVNSIHITACSINEIVVEKDNVRLVYGNGVTVTTLNVIGEDVVIQLSDGATITTVVISATAEGTQINIEKGTTIGTVTINAPTIISGEGTITTANVKSEGVEIEKKPTNVTVDTGITANIEGKEVKGGSSSGGGGVTGGISDPTNPGNSNNKKLTGTFDNILGVGAGGATITGVVIHLDEPLAAGISANQLAASLTITHGVPEVDWAKAAEDGLDAGGLIGGNQALKDQYKMWNDITRQVSSADLSSDRKTLTLGFAPAAHPAPNSGEILYSNQYMNWDRSGRLLITPADGSLTDSGVRNNVVLDQWPLVTSQQMADDNFPVRGMTNYRVFTPNITDPNTPVPIIIWLHGNGERGNDGLLQVTRYSFITNYGTPEIQSIFGVNGVFVIAPQVGSGGAGYVPADFMAAILHVIAQNPKVNFDMSRIYIGGLSNGGAATWSTILEYPNFFAAAVPSAAATNEHSLETLKTVAHLPIWQLVDVRDREAANIVPSAISNHNRLNDIGEGNNYISWFTECAYELNGVTYNIGYHQPWIWAHGNFPNTASASHLISASNAKTLLEKKMSDADRTDEKVSSVPTTVKNIYGNNWDAFVEAIGEMSSSPVDYGYKSFLHWLADQKIDSDELFAAYEKVVDEFNAVENTGDVKYSVASWSKFEEAKDACDLTLTDAASIAEISAAIITIRETLKLLILNVAPTIPEDLTAELDLGTIGAGNLVIPNFNITLGSGDLGATSYTIKHGEKTLTAYRNGQNPGDYRVQQSSLTLYNSFIKTLEVGEVVLTVTLNDTAATSFTVTITVSDTANP
jgi:predicted esterase